MRASFPFVSTALFLWSYLADGLRAQEQQAGDYLAAVSEGDVPRVFFNVALASTLITFTSRNDGKAVLILTTGTGGTRDPFIVKAQDSSKASHVCESTLMTQKVNEDGDC